MLFFNIFRVFVPIILVLVQPSLGFWRMLCGNYDGLCKYIPIERDWRARDIQVLVPTFVKAFLLQLWSPWFQ